MLIDRDGLAPAYDVAVVGAGLAGLTAANRLASFGRRVLLVESHDQIGGYAAWFKRRGHVFDVALHAFPEGMKKSFRKYWSREIADRVVPLEHVRFENPQFTLRTRFDREDYLYLLEKNFTIPREQSLAFFDACRALNFYDDRNLTTGELLQRHFPDRPEVWRLLLETVTYATGVSPADPAVAYGIVFSNFMQGGTYTLAGGTDGLMAEMRNILDNNGVDILLRSPVEKILVGAGRAVGVRVGGRPVAARAVVSNANLKGTLFNLIGRENLPPELAVEAEGVALSASVAQVYMGFKEGVGVPGAPDLLFASSEPVYDAARYRDYPPTCLSYSYYRPRHLRPDQDRWVIAASMCANWSDWSGLDPEAYRAKKRDLCRRVVTDLESRHPGLAASIDHIEAATPRTLARYTGHWEGASFGTKFEGFTVSEKLPRALGGVFHTGSAGIIMSGWLGAVNYGAIVAGNAEAYLDSAP